MAEQDKEDALADATIVVIFIIMVGLIGWIFITEPSHNDPCGAYSSCYDRFGPPPDIK